MKRYASQSRINVLRSTSISPLIIRKQRQVSINSKSVLNRPTLQTQGNSSNIKSNQIIEKKNFDRQNQQSRLTNNKSDIVTYTTIIPPHTKQLTSNTPSTTRSTSFSYPKVRRKKKFFFFCFYFFRNFN
jgi:hypothetical protein